MQLDGRLVIVPQWLIDSVKQMGLPMSSLINLNELAEHFSGDDIIAYHGVNKLFYELRQKHQIDGNSLHMECYGNTFELVDLLKLAKATRTDDDSFIYPNKLFSGIEEGGLVFLKEADNMNSLFNTLTSKVYNDYTPTNPNVYVINLFHIENKTFGLSLVPYVDVKPDSELSALDYNIELLFTHYSYEDVCKTTIFHRWCHKLRMSQQ